MKISEWLQATTPNGTSPIFGAVRDAVICADGTRFSVQASEYHYSRPRNNKGPWTHVELMVWAPEPLLVMWLDAPVDFNMPFSNVPLHIVDALIEHHGGMHDASLHYAEGASAVLGIGELGTLHPEQT